MRTNSLVQPLFDGPVDVVGDVHGEIDALVDLLRHLGYSDSGRHRDDRRLVFLGDLTDRGPDSPSVVDLVRDLVGAGQARCVLGNHDLNILLGQQKHDNGWFFSRALIDEDRSLVRQAAADDSIRRSVTAFFRTLPLVLERDDVRIVHACWQREMVDLARTASDAVELYREHAEMIEAALDGRDLDKIDRGLEHQNRNPVKVLTSGLERRTETPFEASGKLRYEARVAWWTEYRDQPLCAFGHYAQIAPRQDANGRAVCVDFGVGQRWVERGRTGAAGPFETKLAALRLPERLLIFDDGQTVPIK